MPVDLNRAVVQAVDLTRPRWCDMPQGRGLTIEVRTELQEDLPPVQGVESEVREALTNLMINAVDALPESGTITLRTRITATGRTLSSRWPTPGVGMDEETAPALPGAVFHDKGRSGHRFGLGDGLWHHVQRHGARSRSRARWA